MKLSITVYIATILFAAISIDTNLPKRKKRRDDIEVLDSQHDVGDGDVDADHVVHHTVDPDVTVISDPANRARNMQTVRAQTYQNYKSALKFWHEFDNPSMGKVGFAFP